MYEMIKGTVYGSISLLEGLAEMLRLCITMGSTEEIGVVITLLILIVGVTVIYNLSHALFVGIELFVNGIWYALSFEWIKRDKTNRAINE